MYGTCITSSSRILLNVTEDDLLKSMFESYLGIVQNEQTKPPNDEFLSCDKDAVFMPVLWM